MILTESVRDAADLYLSLKFPPVMFVCDTPCTLVQHINNRSPEHTKHFWGENDGCFEKPNLENNPRLTRMSDYVFIIYDKNRATECS